jgi:putative acetyltransferase
MRVEPEDDSDHDAIASVVSRAFGSPIEARLIDAIRASESFVAGWSLVAVIDNHIVGHVMVSYATLQTGEDGRRTPNLSPLSVDPDYQGRGIGSALVRAVAQLVDSAGEPLIVLEGNPVYYARFGFEHAAPRGITLPLPDWAPSEAAQILRLSAYAPDVRGHVIYPPAFDLVADLPAPNER